MINIKKVYPPLIRYCAKVIPLAFDESLSYYECICNIANHINNEIIPKVNESSEIINEVQDEVVNLKEYVDDNMLTKDVNDLTNYTKTSDLSNVALTGNYNDLSNKPTIPDVSNFITKDVNDLTYYTLSSNLSSVATSGSYNDLSDKPTIPDVSNFITKDVNDLTYYTKTSDLSTVATTGDYDDLIDKPTIPDVSNFITKDVNDLTYYTLTSNLSNVATSGNYNDLSNKPTIPDVSNFITKDVNDLTYYTTTTALTTLLSGKENSIEYGNNTNGYYVKFDSGLLVMWGTSNFTGGNTYTSVTFPVTLYSTGTSYMFVSKRYASGSTAIYNYAITPQINDANSGFIYVKAQDGSNITSDQKIDWLVLGKWK